MSPSGILILGLQIATHWTKLMKYGDDLIDNTRAAEMTTKQYYTNNILGFIDTLFFPSKDTNRFVWIVINLVNVYAFESLLKVLRVIEKWNYYSAISNIRFMACFSYLRGKMYF